MSEAKPQTATNRIDNSGSLTSDNVLKITTYNVASLRAAWNKGFPYYVKSVQPDILCIQETKMHPSAKPPVEEFKIEGYHAYFLHADRKGYAGTAIYTKIKPISVSPSDGVTDPNGRCITMEFAQFFLVNSYVVNAGQNGTPNLDYKVNVFNPQIEAHIEGLRKKKAVIWAGDLNVAHRDIDIWTTEGFESVAGFTSAERQWFDAFLKKGYTDVFRDLYPTKQQFTFFDFRGGARAKNQGWRIDYFIINNESKREGLIIDCFIDTSSDISDHLPVNLLLNRSMILDSNKDLPVKGMGVTVIKKQKNISTLDSFFSSK